MKIMRSSLEKFKGNSNPTTSKKNKMTMKVLPKATTEYIKNNLSKMSKLTTNRMNKMILMRITRRWTSLMINRIVKLINHSIVGRSRRRKISTKTCTIE
jgi:ribosomal protein L23